MYQEQLEESRQVHPGMASLFLGQPEMDFGSEVCRVLGSVGALVPSTESGF